MKTPLSRRAAAFEESRTAPRRRSACVLRLYVAGATARSARAIFNLKAVCEAHLAGRYDLQIIDIYQQPHLARQEQIVVVPLLIKQAPEPVQRFVGDLGDDAQLLTGLGIAGGEAG